MVSGLLLAAYTASGKIPRINTSAYPKVRVGSSYGQNAAVDPKKMSSLSGSLDVKGTRRDQRGYFQRRACFAFTMPFDDFKSFHSYQEMV